MLYIYWAVLFVIFPALTLCGSKINAGNEYVKKAFPREASLFWRGVSALMVVFAHLTIFLEDEGVGVGPAVIFDWVGGMGVLLFFFLSGYGTAKSNSIVNIKWLVQHVLRLWIPVSILRVFFYFGYNVSKEFSFGPFIMYVIGIDRPAWFIAVMLTVYLTVYLARRFFSNHYVLALLLLNILSSVVFYLAGFSPSWYNGHLVFVFGTWLALNGPKVIPYMRKHWGMCLAVCLVAFVVFGYAFARLKPRIISAPLKLLAGVALGTMVVLLSQKIQVHGKAMCLIGRTSLFLYIIHQNLYEIMRQDYFSLSPYFVVFVSIPVAMTLSFACVELEKKLLKK